MLTKDQEWTQLKNQVDRKRQKLYDSSIQEMRQMLPKDKELQRFSDSANVFQKPPHTNRKGTIPSSKKHIIVGLIGIGLTVAGAGLCAVMPIAGVPVVCVGVSVSVAACCMHYHSNKGQGASDLGLTDEKTPLLKESVPTDDDNGFDPSRESIAKKAQESSSSYRTIIAPNQNQTMLQSAQRKPLGGQQGGKGGLLQKVLVLEDHAKKHYNTTTPVNDKDYRRDPERTEVEETTASVLGA